MIQITVLNETGQSMDRAIEAREMLERQGEITRLTFIEYNAVRYRAAYYVGGVASGLVLGVALCLCFA